MSTNKTIVDVICEAVAFLLSWIVCAGIVIGLLVAAKIIKVEHQSEKKYAVTVYGGNGSAPQKWVGINFSASGGQVRLKTEDGRDFYFSGVISVEEVK